jgi:hypothetical protein
MGTILASGLGMGMGTIPEMAAFAETAPNMTIVAQMANRRMFLSIST